MTGPIPEEWRKRVVAVLRGRVPGATFEVVLTARRNWKDTFAGAFDHELPDAIARWLSQAYVEGQQVFGMTPPGTVYEFFFFHESTKLYGKVGLHTDNTVVIIFSAHVPRKGDTL